MVVRPYGVCCLFAEVIGEYGCAVMCKLIYITRFKVFEGAGTFFKKFLRNSFWVQGLFSKAPCYPRVNPPR